MENNTNIVVLKFGSSVLRSEKDLPSAVHEIYRWFRQGHQVVAVVSAFGDTTDELNRRAQEVCEQPDDALVAALLATGETASSALLGLSLNRAGIAATVLDAQRAGLRTEGATLDANLVSVDAENVIAALRSHVVVLPGFVGQAQTGQTTLLGRGGSDLTALFLAKSLGGYCRLIKDVDGLYTSDPNSKTGQPACRFSQISYETAERVGGAVVQLKAIKFAKEHGVSFGVSSVGSNRSTEVGALVDRIDAEVQGDRRLRVALLGCGTVGGGVFKRLAALPHLFEVVGVGVRNVDRAIELDVPVRLITTNLDKLIERPCDVVIELLGGLEPARALVTRALQLGRDVVTANKSLLATELTRLERLAAVNGGRIRYSAAVGGVAPALETVRRVRSFGELKSITGILNGTTNFILNEHGKGRTFEEAVQLAQQLGYAESDPTVDLDGTDAAQKLILLAREAFGIELPFGSIKRKGIDETTVSHSARHIKFIAHCKKSNGRVEASVAPVEIEPTDLLSSVNGVSNCLVIEDAEGKTWTASGQGAGRWPTTEAVIADLLDLRCETIAEELQLKEECVA